MGWLTGIAGAAGELVQGSLHFIQAENLLLMLLAVTVGIIFGVLPGLSATIGIALVTGLTYGCSLDTALIILLGVYIGAIYGGSISAILINIPGTGSAAATCLDGHPLAIRGEAQNANTLARISSFIGTVFGMGAFVFLTPLVTRMALQFTSPEFFWLVLFGVIVCGSISSPDLPIKGWIAGLLGVLLAMVGQEDIQGWERLTFGNPNLATGIPFVPMTIAFFGIPQIIRSMKEPRAAVCAGSGERTVAVWPLIRRNILGILRWGLMGVGIGAIPGVGENIAAWIAYGDAKRRPAANGRQFGEGAYEGVMAPETANNAAIGGAVIPLISLGIPGSPPTAMLLGALMLHGIRPGPLLNLERPGLIIQLAVIILWGSFFLLICGLLLTKVMSLVLRIPHRIMMPIIAVLCVAGTFAYNNDPFHLVLVFVFGVVGYMLDRMSYSPAPLILGLILGNMADAFFRRALLLNHGNVWGLINRPTSAVLCGACLLAIFNQFGVIERVRRRLRRKQPAREPVYRGPAGRVKVD